MSVAFLRVIRGGGGYGAARMKPVIAIVGRPNVGKSALFNRLVGRRIAIVHDQPGVTRDRVSARAAWGERRFEMVDTGGLTSFGRQADADTLTAEARKQVAVAIEDAAVILFVVDITAGLTPLDHEVARQLHASGRAVFTVANKADTEPLDRQADDFRRIGFPVFPVSALHNRGFEELMDVAVARLPPEDLEAAPAALKVAVVGRPNAGKSSYINRLLRSDRVIVSPVPGTTRDSIEVPFSVGSGPLARHYLLVDTAGMRQRSKVDGAVEKFSLLRAEQSIEEADVVVLALDGAEGPTMQDKKIAALILEARRGCVVLVNKWDLLAEGATTREYTEAFRRAVPFLGFVPMVFASAKSGYNIRKSVEVIDQVAAQITTEVPTSTLNKVLHGCFERVQPPMVQGRRMKFYYATQTGTKPVRFRLFVNDTVKLTDAYRLYLINQLRQAFGLEGAPIVLNFASSHEAKKP